MAEDGNKIGMLGVLIGAVIVVLVGGGILYATGALDTRPNNVTIQQPAPAATPAPVPEPDRTDRDRRSERRDRDDDRRGRDDRPDGDDDRRGRDGPDRR